jgi:hypothetical protein
MKASRQTIISVCMLLAFNALGERFAIQTPQGSVSIDISHVSPAGSLVAPSAPVAPAFHPPSIFSAPLPSGSGARALGLGGAFTAVADDATAASWNPAGLIQLERPEASLVLRYRREDDANSSESDLFYVEDNSFDSENVNYFSVDYPFRWLNRNMVVSINYQEAYDFKRDFSARAQNGSLSRNNRTSSETYEAVQQDHFPGNNLEIDVTSYLTTRKTSVLSQVLDSDLLSDIEFKQRGIIDAVTPALAFEITPKLSMGMALNYYQDSPIGSQSIRSKTRAHYSGTSSSSVLIDEEEVTGGHYTYTVTAFPPPDPFEGESGGIVVSTGSGTIPEFSGTSSSRRNDSVYVEGFYEEENEFDDLQGMNATFGLLWTVSRHLSLGASVDLPWTAEARQTKTVRNSVTTFSTDRTRVLDQSDSESIETRDVEFNFPLYWAVGAVWRWNNRLYSTLDVNQTRWSDFSYRAEGEGKINPFDGSPYGENELDDTWAIKTGLEYLMVFSQTEVPLRAGLGWEQRPAIGNPDEFWSLSLGSGVAIGKDPGRVILDVAYVIAYGQDVLGSLVPGQEGLSTDVTEQSVYVSCIKHF